MTLLSVPGGWRHDARGDVGSTNDLAFAAALAGDPGRLWITGERQTSGRGRQARPWVSEPGNLYASALLINPAAMDALSTFPLVVALSVHDCAARLFPHAAPRLRLKWPNDLLLDGAKCAGVLIEARRLDDERLAVVMGCGVNLAHHPVDTPYPATDFSGEGPPVEPLSAFRVLAATFSDRLAQWQEGRGRPDIVVDWRALAAGLGERIRVRLPHETIEGRFADLDPSGYLVLELDNGDRRSISAGDVFF